MHLAEAANNRLRWAAAQLLKIAGVALAISIIGAFFNSDQFFHSYLFGYLFWMNFSLGSLALLMLHHVVGGRSNWGYPIQKVLESGVKTLPLMALLFLPFLFELESLYEWARPDAVAQDSALQHKSAYLNEPFFVVRAALYFAIWLGLGYVLNRWSARQDRLEQPEFAHRLRITSAPGLLLYVLTATFASIDWAMSLEPHWFSAIYGLLFISEQFLAALALAILLLAYVGREEPLASSIDDRSFHDLGNLMLAALMIWAYMAFSQFLIIWSANLAEEIPWYLHRSKNGWEQLAVALIVLAFFVPFLFLLSRPIKRNRKLLLFVASGIVLMRFFNMLWMVVPSFEHNGLALSWMDFLVPLGLGALWLWRFLLPLTAHPFLSPIHAARGET